MGLASRRFGALFLTTACLAGGVGSLSAQRTLEVGRFHTELEVAEDGSLRVHEAITYRFNGSWNGVFRDIPVVTRDPQGLNRRIYLSDVSIRDDGGDEYEWERSRRGSDLRFKVWVPGAADVVRTVHFRYTVDNALLFFDGEGDGFAEGYDELYWNATGDESEIPILAASALVRLPAGASGARAQAYTGRYGSTASDVTITENELEFYFESTRRFGPREGLTVDVAWNPGVVRRPTMLDRATRAVTANWLLVLPLISLVGMWRLWRSKGRDPERRAISPQYEPPKDLTPADVGTLVDNRVDVRDITATLVDLAIRGYLRIEEQEGSYLEELVGKGDYAFRLLKDQEEWADLEEHEQELLESVFGSKRKVDLDDLEHSFYIHIPDIKNSIYQRLVALRCYDRRPDKVVAKWMIVGGLVLPLGITTMILVSLVQGTAIGVALVAAVLTAVPIFVFGSLMPARTVHGARQLEHVLGFQEFMNRVDADRFKRMIDSPEMFERYLPHAMALGVERQWAKAFDDIYKEPPEWYRGQDHGSFQPSRFTTSLGEMSTRTGSVMTSQPRSSGSSGFSSGGGGGFSGGGGGGGGTGGF
jgi:hypothetical protein